MGIIDRIFPGSAPTPPPTPVPPKAGETDWTVLLYVDGTYPDLEPVMAESVSNLETLGSDDRLRFVAQFGRSSQQKAHPDGTTDGIDGDWKGTKRYYIVKNPALSRLEVPLATWESVAEAIPENPLAHYALAEAYAQEGSPLLRTRNILDWPGFLESLKKAGNPDGPPILRQLRDKLTSGSKAIIDGYIPGQVVGDDSKSRIIENLNDLLEEKDLFAREDAQSIPIGDDAKLLLAKEKSKLTEVETLLLNRYLLEGLYQNEISKCRDKEMTGPSKEEYAKAEKLGYMSIIREENPVLIMRWTRRTYKSELLADLGNTSMQRPESLRDFIASSMKQFPSKHYMVVMMGHGSAWQGTSEISPKSIALAVRDAVVESNRETGRGDKVDTLVFNSCYMSNLEALREFPKAAQTVVASEMAAQANVFQHWASLGKVIGKTMDSDPDVDAKEMAATIVKYFKEWGEKNKTNPDIIRLSYEGYRTLTAVDMEKIPLVTEAFDKLLADWKWEGAGVKQLLQHVDSTKAYPSNAYSPAPGDFYSDMRDLGDLMRRIQEDPTVPKVLAEDARKVRAAISEAILDEQHTGQGMEGSTGMTFWGPNRVGEVRGLGKLYKQSVPTFVQETRWEDLLEEAAQRIQKLGDNKQTPTCRQKSAEASWKERTGSWTPTSFPCTRNPPIPRNF
ncbi:MAG: hypothetical protein HYU64_08775 [Armatimonadetes bacterium]|nr:hypothetical protein [Armatimonadota bacterium]